MYGNRIIISIMIIRHHIKSKERVEKLNSPKTDTMLHAQRTKQGKGGLE